MNIKDIVNNGTRALKIWRDYPIIFREKEIKEKKYHRNDSFEDTIWRAYSPHHLDSLGCEVLEGLAYGGLVYSSLPDEGFLSYLQHPSIFLMSVVTTITLRNMQVGNYNTKKYNDKNKK